MSEHELEFIDGDQVKIDLPSDREIRNQFKQVILSMVLDKISGRSMEDISTSEAQELWEEAVGDMELVQND